MVERRIDLGWLRILAEVGRRGSLSGAAESLGLTQPAVSYQIRRLEEETGIDLLRRRHRGVELTPEGRRLFEIVSRTADEVDEWVRDLRRRHARPSIRLGTDYAFASFWLIPRMHDFRQINPDIDIEIAASQIYRSSQADHADLAVVFAARKDLPANAHLLLPERVLPVCSQAFLERQAPAELLPSARLLHLSAPAPVPWFDWSSYLAEAGLPRRPATSGGELSFNTYSMVIQAALAGQGVALGWLGLVDEMLSSGMLVAAGPVVEAPERGYWLLPPRRGRRDVDSLTVWLKATVAAS